MNHKNLTFTRNDDGTISRWRKNGSRKKKPHPLADKIVERVDDETGVIVKVCPTQGAWGYWPQGSAK